ncbi:DUF559 domain-containing protein [Pontibacter korlensis]|uniref:endonuclease domain-containing protein n=1 Tax=Pontibacter korlensis TaxID=400092 RepID=UPI0008FFD9FA|nr:DUF559 domain-containing protein [Pontibacter korlensis]
MKLHHRAYLKENRKILRNNSPPAEGELWKYLKSGQLQGQKFRRQHSIGNYILDFYCPSEEIAIELDGQVHIHSAAQQADQERDEELAGLGIKLLRFEHKDIFHHLEAVLQEIIKFPALDKEGLGVVGSGITQASPAYPKKE